LRYGEDFILFVKGETVLRGKIDRLIDIGTCNGMEKFWTREPSLLQIMKDKRKLKNVENFNRSGFLMQYLQGKLNVGYPW